MNEYPSGIGFPFGVGPTGGIDTKEGALKTISNMNSTVNTAVGNRLVRKNFGSIGYGRVFRSAHRTTLQPIKMLIKKAFLNHVKTATDIQIDMFTREEEGVVVLYADVSFTFSNTGERVKASIDIIRE